MNNYNVDNFPLVSIAVCTYNGQTYLREQLDSLVNQSYPQLEIIVADDCSNDDTLMILEDYSKEFSYFKYYKNEINLGYVKNFERVISLCSGEYIALSDQDDVWSLDKIRLQIDSIGDHALIYHNSICIDERGKTLSKKLSDVYTLYQGDTPYPFLFFNCVSGHSMLFSKQIIPDLIPFPKDYFHDRWIAMISSERGGIKLLQQDLVKYRQHTLSTTDLLKIKNLPENNVDKFFNKEVLDWIIMCRNKSVHYQDYFTNLLTCFTSETMIVNRFKLFFLLFSKIDLIFFTIKKSRSSRINYLRKICFRPKHS
jgi:glycosyltransferase involved in cell wall biosynthesis